MKAILKLTSSMVGLSLTGLVAAQETQRPNIIYVFPDQFRNSALSFWDNADFKNEVNFNADPTHTPNLNKFARESVVFSSAQSNCPLSSPHRGMLLTGMYPDGSGVSLNCMGKRPISNLREDAVTISDVLSQNGYDCGYIGKLHLDYPTPNNPQNPGTYVNDTKPVWDAYTPKERRHGFNFWYSYGTFDQHKNPHYWDSNGERHEIREWSPKHEADKAIEYLSTDRDKKKPFFLVVSMNPPHSPYRSLDDCMEVDYNLYKDIPLNQLLVRPNVNPKLKERQENAPYYFASVSGVDREFGRILDALKQMGLDKNTIVVFSSDHGETLSSHVADAKNSPYTEALNVPFIVRYPEKLKPHVTNLLLSTPDIMPTLLSLSGMKNEIPKSVQGDDLTAFMSSNNCKQGAPEGVLYIRNVDGDKDAAGLVLNYFPIARGVKTNRYTMAITVDKNRKLKEVLLFDDEKDPYQMNSLSYQKNPKLFKSLCTKMAKLLVKADDPWFRDKMLSDLIVY